MIARDRRARAPDDPASDPGGDLTVDALFRAQVAGRRDALAIACGEQRLTFGEFAARSQRLAARLRALGVTAERRVALIMDRSIDLAVATLAIIAAGGAFVPLDPGTGTGTSGDRVRALAAAAGADLTVTRASLRHLLDGANRAVVLVDEHDAHGVDPRDAVAPWPGSAPRASRLLYVMHTSGSTAAPRAVEVEHGSSVDQILRLAGDLGLGRNDRHVHTAAIGFTLAVRQLLLPLCLGGAVVIARHDELGDPLALLRAAKHTEATVLDAVPSLLARIVAALQALPAAERTAVIPDRLRLVLTAGERLRADVVRGWWSIAGTGARVIQLYGASEVGGSVAWREVVAADLGRAVIPIGHPRTGTIMAVVDPDRASLVPVGGGEIGELCVAGPAVARGYVRGHAPDRARFVAGAPAPGDPAPGARWFRTGDLVRRGPDGALELLGRLDEEVKIRGVRVQPEAVEAVLAGIAGVDEAAVVASDRASDPPRLVAYVAGPALPRDAALRERVRAELPAAFVPAVIVRLGALPRLATGKVDRRALRARATGDVASGGPPSSALECLIARHWETVLGIAPRGVHDDFFALGGSSLAAFELSARLAAALAQALPAALAFDRPTLGEQAAWLAERAAPPGPAVRLERDDRAAHGPRAVSFAQERIWLGELLARSAHTPRVHRGLRITGRLDEPRLERAMRAVAERHEALRTTFITAGGQPYQRVHASLPRDHQTVDLAASAAGERADELARRQADEWRRPFDLERGPLWRTRLIRLEPDAHVLLLTIHHLVSDGWSMQRWLDEVSAYYTALPGAPALPALRVQPADAADWQRRCLASGAYDGARAYWREQLAGAPAPPELPHDGPRGDTAGAWQHGELAGAAVARLRDIARAAGTTLFAVLVAALAQLTAELTGADDVTIGALAAGRDRPALRPLIGLFLNTLPLRVRLGRSHGFAAAIASARGAVHGALAHAELPFERIVADANPPRQLRRNPLFDIALNYLPATATGPLGDLAVEPVAPGPDVAAPFDAMWRVIERGDRLEIRVEYRRARFSPQRIRDWLDRYLALLAGAAGGA